MSSSFCLSFSFSLVLETISSFQLVLTFPPLFLLLSLFVHLCKPPLFSSGSFFYFFFQFVHSSFYFRSSPLYPPLIWLLSSVGIYRKNKERGLLPLSSHGTGVRGGRAAVRQLPQGCLQGLSPLYFFLMVSEGYRFCQGSGKWGEREKKTGE